MCLVVNLVSQMKTQDSLISATEAKMIERQVRKGAKMIKWKVPTGAKMVKWQVPTGAKMIKWQVPTGAKDDQMASYNRSKDDQMASSIQYGNRIYETSAEILSLTLANESSKNEMGGRNRRRQARKENTEINKEGTK